MAREQTRVLNVLTFVLMALATAASEIAAAGPGSLVWSLGMAALWIAAAAAANRLLPRPGDNQKAPPRFVAGVMLVLAAAPFVIDPIRRTWGGEYYAPELHGHALELQMVFALRNLGLGLAAFSAWLPCLRLACVVSLFLMLFAVSTAGEATLLIFLGLYCAAGSLWLTVAYWNGLRRFFVASESSMVVERYSGRGHMPWLAVVFAVALVSGTMGLVAVGPMRSVQLLWELLPTSGGTGEFDPYARSGVNDGDEETAGANARSTGLMQSDSVIESPLPSLYDILNELYGEPARKTERTIALDPQTQVNASAKSPSDNLRPSREFPTVRKSPRQPRDPASRSTLALFEVQGRTPLHVRVAAYDLFDGVTWKEAPVGAADGVLEKEWNSFWMALKERDPPAILVGSEMHRIKVTGALGSLVPTPTHLQRFRVGRIDQADFFAWSQDRILRMAGRPTPAGTIVETECRLVDPGRLEDYDFGVVAARRTYLGVPGVVHPEARALAQAWAADRARGWPQIAAVLHHLRTEFVVDPTVRLPDDCADSLGHFLLESRRGPDYQFASAAAILVRELGYPTRLVSGFYVEPENYDPRTRHTPVVREDAHFWAEVMLPSGDWMVMEPTPGYEVLAPTPSWTDHVGAALAALAAFAWEHGIALSLMALAAAGGWRWRRECFDRIAVLLFTWFPGQTWRQHVQRALWLLEWRGRCAGRGRPAFQTASAWLRALQHKPDEVETRIDRLLAMTEWAAYGGDLMPPWQEDETLDLCRRVVAEWTLRRWRKLAVER